MSAVWRFNENRFLVCPLQHSLLLSGTHASRRVELEQRLLMATPSIPMNSECYKAIKL